MPVRLPPFFFACCGACASRETQRPITFRMRLSMRLPRSEPPNSREFMEKPRRGYSACGKSWTTIICAGPFASSRSMRTSTLSISRGSFGGGMAARSPNTTDAVESRQRRPRLRAGITICLPWRSARASPITLRCAAYSSAKQERRRRRFARWLAFAISAAATTDMLRICSRRCRSCSAR